MNIENRKYWKGLEQLTQNDEFEKHADKEFAEKLPLPNEIDSNSSRRDFLKMMGFSVAAASLAACEAPIRKAIPYVEKPVDVDPGIPNYYASTYVVGSDVCPVVVKTREGRPIKVEGNKLSKVSGGGTSTQIEASVLSLYDQERLQYPLINGKPSTWDEIDNAIKADLENSSGRIAIISNSICSPSTIKAIEDFRTTYSKTDHIQYDQYSFSGLLDAHAQYFGKRVFPYYDFTNTDTIVSFGADFLGNWPNQTLISRQFAETRKLGDNKKSMSRLYAFESNLSLTGANADYRTPVRASQQGLYILNLYNLIAQKAGRATVSTAKIKGTAIMNQMALDLWKSKGKSLVLSGSNDLNVQIVVAMINEMLENYGKTINTNNPIKIRSGDDSGMDQFVKDLNNGAYSGVIFYNCNPVYDHALGDKIKTGIEKCDFSISSSDRNDETNKIVKYKTPDHHYLESWNDYEPVKNYFSFSQPTIRNIFNTRQFQASLLKWSGDNDDYYQYLKDNWKEKMGISSDLEFQMKWDKMLHDGIFNYNEPEKSESETTELEYTQEKPSLESVIASISSNYEAENNELELVVYENQSIGNGIMANNPWLQEMPDPITKACWDNYLTISPKLASEWGIKLGDMQTQLVNLTVSGKSQKIPVLVQPGQAYGTMGLSLGYGRTIAGKVANEVGVNAYQFLEVKNGFVSYSITKGIKVEPTSDSYKIAQTQTHQTYMGRHTVLQESVLPKYQQDPTAGRHFTKISAPNGKLPPGAVTLWKGHNYNNHHWGMMIDLNSCIGCGACTIACQAENNIPVVGKDEVLMRREMAWLRIDRYYSHEKEQIGEGENAKVEENYEKAASNPDVVFQPMLCQQCNNAPCETVCPVAATTHSSEGLNQMTYNRCIGTRYCANNCPYKVRRFNWFKYHDNDQFQNNLAMNNDLGKMALNPDVTVRARGVMEKCTFCVQRIQAGKLEAKKERRRPRDGEINTACANSCPTEAIVFGDLNDKKSRVYNLLKIQQKDTYKVANEPRAFHVLDELRVQPNIWYLTKIKNKENIA